MAELDTTAGPACVDLYCFSGTGNALKASYWFAERAEAAGASARIVRIAPGARVELPATPPRTLLGFLFSTHGFCAPWSVLRLIARMPRRAHRAVDAFLLNTRAGIKTGPLFWPGVSGIALLLPLLMLWLKGYRVVGTRPLDMPTAWLAIHPGMRDASANAISERRRGQVVTFADRLLSGRRAFHGFWTLPLDLAVGTIAPLYLVAGRFFLAKLQVASEDCDGCGVCAAMCPARAIEIRHSRAYWTFDCESCMRCYSLCPRRAVQCSHPFLAAVIAVSLLLAEPVEGAVAWVAARTSPWLGEAADLVAWTAISLAVVYPAYHLLFQAMRWRPVAWVLARGSLNHYWRRYLAPGIALKDFRAGAPRPPPDPRAEGR